MNPPIIAIKKAQTKIPDDVTQCPFPEEKNERIKKEQDNYRWFLPDAPDVTDDQGTHEFFMEIIFLIFCFDLGTRTDQKSRSLRFVFPRLFKLSKILRSFKDL